MENNLFNELYSVNVNDKAEKKNGLTYLTWSYAIAEFKRKCPDMTYEILKFNGLPYVYDDNTGYMVYTRVTAGGITHEMWLPVMDGANRAMKAEPYTYYVKNPNFKYAKICDDGIYRDKYGNKQTEYIEKTCEAATMFDVNKTIMRCLVKNFAMFGLGLYIYAGEDLPEEEPKQQEPPKDDPKPEKKKAIKTEPVQKPEEKTEEKQERAYITPVMLKALQSRCLNDKVSMPALCEIYKVENLGMLTMKQYQNMNEFWEQVKEKIGGKV